MSILSWSIGLGLSLGVAPVFVWCLMKLLRQDSTPNPRFYHPAIVGTLERLFFTICVAFDLSAVTVAMIAWITVKMATRWNFKAGEDADRKLAFSALIGGMSSMLFVVLGGLIAKGEIPVPF